MAEPRGFQNRKRKRKKYCCCKSNDATTTRLLQSEYLHIFSWFFVYLFVCFVFCFFVLASLRLYLRSLLEKITEQIGWRAEHFDHHMWLAFRKILSVEELGTLFAGTKPRTYQIIDMRGVEGLEIGSSSQYSLKKKSCCDRPEPNSYS